MCRCCKDITNIHERIANHDFMEQMREFYGLEEKHLKGCRGKKSKKSVIARIEHQIAQMMKTEHSAFVERLCKLLEAPFDGATTPTAFESIMEEFYEIRKTQIFEYFKSQGLRHG